MAGRDPARTLGARARIVVLLDCAPPWPRWTAAASKLDYAVAATLALTRVAAARGPGEIVAFRRPRAAHRPRPLGGPRGGPRLQALYDLRAQLAEPAYDLAAEATFDVEPRSATAVLFTSVVDLAAAELLRESLLR